MDQQILKVWRPTPGAIGSIFTETVFSYESIDSKFCNATRSDSVIYANSRPLPKNLGKSLSPRAYRNKRAHLWNMYIFFIHNIDTSYFDWLNCQNPCRYPHQTSLCAVVEEALTRRVYYSESGNFFRTNVYSWLLGHGS